MEWEVLREVLYDKEDDIKAGKQVDVDLYNKEIYENVYVRAIISMSGEELPGGENLWVRDFQGRLDPKPWTVKVLERLTPPWEVAK